MISMFFILLLIGGSGLTFFLVSHFVTRALRPSSAPASEDEKEQSEPAPSEKTVTRPSPGIYTVFWQAIRHFLYRLLRSSRLMPAGPIYNSFRMAFRMLRNRSLRSNAKYEIPLCMFVGDRSSGKDALLGTLSLPQPIQGPAAACAGTLNWWFFEKGMIINVDSQCLLSQGADACNWMSLLRNLQHWRPRNPLDTVVIAISLEDILAQPEEVYTKAAAKISHPLLLIESTLNMTLPLHIVITKTDFLPGFSGLVESCTDEEIQQILGWTNRYDATKRFDASIVQEAISNVQSDLYGWAMQKFAQGVSPRYRDDIMVFIERLATIEVPLEKYLHALLKMGGYHDNFYVRGISFCGQKDAEDSRVVFSNDLLQEKVFQERGITQPIKRFFTNANRIVLWLRAAIAVIVTGWGGGLSLSHKNLTNTVQTLRPLMYATPEAAALSTAPSHEAQMHSKGFLDMSKKTLELLVQSARYDLFSWFMPPSWISSLETDFDERVFNLYDTFVAQPMHQGFALKFHKLLSDSFSHTNTVEGSLALTDIAAFTNLKEFVDGVESLEDHVILYNALPKTLDTKSFRTVIRYLYDFDLTEQFVTHKTVLQEKVLKNARYRPFHMDAYTQKARERFFDLFNMFIVAGFNPDRLFECPRTLQDALDRIDRSGVDSLEEIYSLLEAIDNSIAMFTQTGSWLTQEGFVAPKLLEGLLETIEKTTFLGKKVVEHAHESLEKIFHKTTLFLESFGSPMTGHFFVRSQETGLLIPGVGLVALRKALVLALKQGFMQRSAHEALTQKIPHGQILHWDKHMVQKAMLLIKDFQNFIDNDLQAFPVEIQDAMRQISIKQLEANVETALARAQTFFHIPVARWSNRSEEVARAYADNLQEVTPTFAAILEELDRIGAHNLFITLRTALFKQMYGHLEQLDELVQKGAFLYPDIGNLRWWKGSVNPIFAVYGADDRLEMRSLWGNHLKRFKDVVSMHVIPVLDLLKSPLMDIGTKEAKVIDRWDRVSEHMEAYEAGKDSSLKMLETFIMEEGPNISFENHQEYVSQRDVDKKYSDVFLDVIGSIKKGLFIRCQEIMAERAAEDYMQLARYFNTNMAGAYPFTKSVPMGDHPEMEVTPDTLKKFYDDFAKLSPEKLLSIKKHPRFGASFKAINSFLSGMLEVKKFLDTHFAPAQKGDPPGVSFMVEYRANKDRDSMGDHVIDWAVISGEETMSLQEGKVEGYWKSGDPFSVGIQFVAQSPIAPVKDPSHPNMVVLADRALFVYEGIWGWLRMLQVQQATKEQGKISGDNLLTFNIPMVARTTGVAMEKAVVFMRLIPRKVNGQAHRNFRIPKFPTRAPFFEGQIS